MPVRPAEMTPEQIEEYRNRGTFLKQGVFISEDGNSKTTFKDGLVTNVEYTIKPMRPPSLAELNKNGPQRATEADFEHQGISPDGTKPYRPPEERAPTTATSTEPTYEELKQKYPATYSTLARKNGDDTAKIEEALRRANTAGFDETTGTNSTGTTGGGLIPSTPAQAPVQAPISTAAQRQNALNQSRANDAAGISNISEPENP